MKISQDQRKILVTPLLRYIASIRLYSVAKTVGVISLFFAGVSAATWRFLVAKKWVEDVEYEGNVYAEKKALEAEAVEDDNETGGKSGRNGKGKGKKK